MGVPESHLQSPMISMFDWRQKILTPSTGDRLRMMSWNILAERLVSQEFFPYVKPEYLSYDYRIDLVVRCVLFRKGFSTIKTARSYAFKRSTQLTPSSPSSQIWGTPITTDRKVLCREF